MGAALAWVGAGAALAAAAGLQQLRRPLRTGQTGELRLERIADGVYLWRAYFSNAAALVLGDRLLVVDTLVSPLMARRMRADLQQAVGKPVGWVVLTHFHGDHVGGTSVFADVPRLACAQTAACMSARDDDRQAYARTFGLLTHDLPEVLPPTRLLDGDATELELGGECVQVLRLGAAETDDACALWWPARRVLACGDSVPTAGFPFSGAPIGDEGLRDDGQWLACLQRIRDLQPEILLPGHGPALVGRAVIAARIDRVAALFRELLDVARRERALGGSPEQVVGRCLRQLGHWNGQADLRQNAISLRMTVLRAVHAVSPERRGGGWWHDLGPRCLTVPDAARAQAELSALDSAAAANARALALVRQRQAGAARDLWSAAAARFPQQGAALLGTCSWALFGAARKVASAYEGSDALVEAGQVAARALQLDPTEPRAHLTLGVLEVLSSLMLGQPMQPGRDHLAQALQGADLGQGEQAAARFFVGKSHQFDRNDVQADLWMRQALPRWLRFVYPLFRDKLRAIP